MIHLTCRLTAKNRDQLRNPTLGNRVWASFTFFLFYFIANIYPINRLQTTASFVQAIASRHLAVRGGVFVARKFNISFSTYFQKIANKPHHRQSNQSMYGLRRKVDAYHRTLPQVCTWSFGEAWSNLLTHYIQKIIWCVYCVIISYER